MFLNLSNLSHFDNKICENRVQVSDWAYFKNTIHSVWNIWAQGRLTARGFCCSAEWLKKWQWTFGCFAVKPGHIGNHLNGFEDKQSAASISSLPAVLDTQSSSSTLLAEVKAGSHVRIFMWKNIYKLIIWTETEIIRDYFKTLASKWDLKHICAFLTSLQEEVHINRKLLHVITYHIYFRSFGCREKHIRDWCRGLIQVGSHSFQS